MVTKPLTPAAARSVTPPQRALRPKAGSSGRISERTRRSAPRRRPDCLHCNAAMRFFGRKSKKEVQSSSLKVTCEEAERAARATAVVLQLAKE
eukprot:6865685-Prymnesium_polylepis.1